MIIPLIILLLVCFNGIRFGKSHAFEGYISKDRTNAIKGIFILLVFLSHIKVYIINAGYEFKEIGDSVFFSIIRHIGQLMVVMFLFYSGYGVMESIRRKGLDYMKAMPKHRILNTLLNFDVAVCVFLIVDLLIGKEISVCQLLLSLVTWDDIGNSNWYIFAILLCYLVTYIAARITKDEKIILRVAFFTLTIVAIGLHFVKESWWYNTLWAYPTGIYYSCYKEKIETFVTSKYLWSVSILFVAFCLVYIMPYEAAGFRTNILSVLFALLVVMLTMRVKIYNSYLRWCGEKLFPLYIYQRVPMIVFYEVIPSKIICEYPLVYIAICFMITIIIAFAYRFIKLSL